MVQNAGAYESKTKPGKNISSGALIALVVVLVGIIVVEIAALLVLQFSGVKTSGQRSRHVVYGVDAASAYSAYTAAEEDDWAGQVLPETTRIEMDETALVEVLNATKIALSVEDVYNALPTGGATVTIADGAKVSASYDELTEEIAKTIPDAIDFTSREYDGSTQTITVTIDTGTGAVSVTGNWLDY
jgi:hypothetical protein